MTFRDVRFPTGIRYGATSAPEFLTRMARVPSGRSKRNSLRSKPARVFTVARALPTNALRDALLAFFYNMNGAGDTFRVKDFADYEVALTEGVFSSLGSGAYQMRKRYTSGAYTKDIDVVLPVSGAVAVTGKTEGVHYSIAYSTGILTLLGSPTGTAPTTWSGNYDVLCRFERDDLPLTATGPGAAGEADAFVFAEDIRLVEETDPDSA